MTDHIVASVADGVGRILFNRPHVMNAASQQMVDGLGAITQDFERDPSVRAILIEGAGEHFMAGADVKEFNDSIVADQNAYAAALEKRVVTGHLAFTRLRRMPKPVLVCAQGITAGMGLSIVAAADLAIAADDASFVLAYRHIGLTADGGVSYFLPRLIGERRAMELALLGKQFSARQALDWGMLNWIEPRATLASRALAIAQELARGPTIALAGAKRLFRHSLESTWEQQQQREAESISQAAATADHREGVAAFIEKRKAAFVGG